MSGTLAAVRRLAAERRVRLSTHAFQRLLKSGIKFGALVTGIGSAVIVEDYPDYFAGPCVLVLQHDADGLPLHVLWGLPKETQDVAVIVTAYRPDSRWDATFLRRVER